MRNKRKQSPKPSAIEYPLEEKIGERELFTNRQEEMAYFFSWIDDIDMKRKSSKPALKSSGRT